MQQLSHISDRPIPAPSRRQPLAAQSAAGTGKDLRAGQAGRIVANPPPVATASPLAFAVVDRIRGVRQPGDRTRSPNDPAAGAMQRGRRRRGKIRRRPPRPRQADTSAATRRFSTRMPGAVGNSRPAVEPSAFGPDLFLPGTLHHSGNRPAPPSEHTPLERRSAFLAAASDPRQAGHRGRALSIRPPEKRTIEQMEPFGSVPRYGQTLLPRSIGAEPPLQ